MSQKEIKHFAVHVNKCFKINQVQQYHQQVLKIELRIEVGANFILAHIVDSCSLSVSDMSDTHI